jgi:hypothetical protein
MGEREPVREPGDGVTVEEGVNDPLPPAEEVDDGGRADAPEGDDGD